LLLVPFLLLALACGGGKGSAPAAPEENSKEAEVSDLDRPVVELLAAKCEHDILTHSCDECRYEVGVVKVPDELFGSGEGKLFKKVVAEGREMASGFDLTGEVQLDGERSVQLGPRVQGVVRSIPVDLGSRVRKGQVLFEVDSDELRRAKADFLRARAAHELAETSELRERELFERRICPQKDLLEAEAGHRQAGAEEAAARGRLEGLGLPAAEIEALSAESRSLTGTVPVRAPFAGVILERSLSLGALVQTGDKSLLLADTSRVWVLTNLNERDVAALQESQKEGPARAEVRVAAYGERTFLGALDRVGGTLDEATRTAKARVVVENPEGLLRAGMFARVKLGLKGGGRAVAIPEASVLDDAGRTFVFVRATGPYYIRRPVKTGRADAGWVEVLTGLKEGDEVVADGAFQLKSDVLRSKMGAGCAD
jgi:cobalt-zinc-cadmium efflux system membrane fusion protein